METLQASESIENMARLAASAGCPRDQVERFARAGFFPFPKMVGFHAAARLADHDGGPTALALGGTRYNGKSHHVMAQVAIDDMQRVPGLKGLFLRKVKMAASEAFEDLAHSVLRYVPHDFKQGQISFPNGSRIIVGGFNNDRDIDKYLGINYDVAVIEEATQLSKEKLVKLEGSVRTAITDWRARIYWDTNPDGIGLQYFKQRFVMPWRQGQQSDTWFADCHWRDNPLARQEYIDYLNKLTGPLAKAWRDGDWDAFAGQAFPEWDYDRHVIQPIEIPASWSRWRAMDYGFIHPMCTLWFGKDPYTGRILVTHEIDRQLLSDRAQARVIQEETPQVGQWSVTYASPDMWASKADEENGLVTSAAKIFEQEKLRLTRADDDRVNGARKVHSVLAPLADGKPGLQIFDTCAELIRCLPAMMANPEKLEDVLKVDCDPATGSDGDDPYDTLRYGLTKLRLPKPEEVVAAATKRNRRPMELADLSHM
jgi:phage terminase large subunit